MPSPPHELIATIVEDGIRRYFAARRARVQPFVDRHFSFRGSAAIHRAALGADVLRAPANLLLAAPHAGMQAAGAVAATLGARRVGRRLQARSLLLRTDVSRRIERLVCTELLELPVAPGGSGRRTTRWPRRSWMTCVWPNWPSRPWTRSGVGATTRRFAPASPTP